MVYIVINGLLTRSVKNGSTTGCGRVTSAGPTIKKGACHILVQLICFKGDLSYVQYLTTDQDIALRQPSLSERRMSKNDNALATSFRE